MISSDSCTNHSTRSLPWMTGRMYSSVVGQNRLSLQTLTTDGFHVTCERERYANRLKRGDLALEAGLGLDLRLVLGDVGEHPVDRVAVLVGADLLVARARRPCGPPAMRRRVTASVFDAVLHAERLVGLGGAGERVVAAVRPVVEHRLEGVAEHRRVEVLDVVELGLAVGVVVAAGEHVDVAVVVHGAEDACRSSPCRRRSPTPRRAAAPAGTCRCSSRGCRSAKRRGRSTRHGEKVNPPIVNALVAVHRSVHRPRTSSCRSSSLMRSPVFDSTGELGQGRSRPTARRCRGRGSSAAGSRRVARW